jgi:transposase-like protein
MKLVKRSFTREFRDDAVKRATVPGAVVTHVANELGIRGSMLARWVREDRLRGKVMTLIDSGELSGAEDYRPVKTEPNPELIKLREQVAELTRERDTLQNTLAFYLVKSMRK